MRAAEPIEDCLLIGQRVADEAEQPQPARVPALLLLSAVLPLATRPGSGHEIARFHAPMVPDSLRAVEKTTLQAPPNARISP